NDPELVERAEIVREKGTNRSRFFRGQVDKYTWVDVGSSYLPSDVLAAYLFAQLQHREAIQAKRRRVGENYRAGHGEWAAVPGRRALPAVRAAVLLRRGGGGPGAGGGGRAGGPLPRRPARGSAGDGRPLGPRGREGRDEGRDGRPASGGHSLTGHGPLHGRPG